ncbi:hypothetical protein B0H17DRAFT_1208220 [Mycena rosella]|uniref:Uncharacterized protein n=1 Tax=Mycena rosella TaxID=1033263 RepID=A0AAD7D1A4_MYCRO|nr:hypothetical protein B0H17DRAFT_1208220 [Mycena rosella]
MGLLQNIHNSTVLLSISLRNGGPAGQQDQQDKDDNENLENILSQSRPPASQRYRAPSPSYEGTPSGGRRVLGPSSSFNATPSTPASQGEYSIPPLPSVLGRWERVNSVTDWSPPTKARLKQFAEDAAREYSVPEYQCQEFVGVSQLPTHKLMIIMLAAVLGGQQEKMADKLQVYLTSSEFKTNVVFQIRAVFLDPNLSSYKTGLLNWLLCHIRLNPGTYCIPQEFWSEITSSAFDTALSNATTTARADLKRKMNAGWKSKTPIYDLVKALTWNRSQEMTDRIWARFTWLQIYLVDYTDEKSPANLFWDQVDIKLAEHRDAAAELPLDRRPAYESFIFEEALKLHLRLCKPQAKKKSSKNLPSWQVEISRAVEEMEGYTQEDLVDEENEPSGQPEGGSALDAVLD